MQQMGLLHVWVGQEKFLFRFNYTILLKAGYVSYKLFTLFINASWNAGIFSTMPAICHVDGIGRRSVNSHIVKD